MVEQYRRGITFLYGRGKILSRLPSTLSISARPTLSEPVAERELPFNRRNGMPQMRSGLAMPLINAIFRNGPEVIQLDYPDCDRAISHGPFLDRSSVVISYDSIDREYAKSWKLRVINFLNVIFRSRSCSLILSEYTRAYLIRRFKNFTRSIKIDVPGKIQGCKHSSASNTLASSRQRGHVNARILYSPKTCLLQVKQQTTDKS